MKFDVRTTARCRAVYDSYRGAGRNMPAISHVRLGRLVHARVGGCIPAISHARLGRLVQARGRFGQMENVPRCVARTEQNSVGHNTRGNTHNGYDDDSDL